MSKVETGVHLCDSNAKFDWKDWRTRGSGDYFTFHVRLIQEGSQVGVAHTSCFFISEDQLREMRDKASEALRSRNPFTEAQEAYRLAGEAFLHEPTPEKLLELFAVAMTLLPAEDRQDILEGQRQLEIRDKVIRECLQVVKSKQFGSVYGDYENGRENGRESGLDAAIEALEELLDPEPQQGKTLMEVFAEEERRQQAEGEPPAEEADFRQFFEAGKKTGEPEPQHWCIAKKGYRQYWVQAVEGHNLWPSSRPSYEEAEELATLTLRLDRRYEFIHSSRTFSPTEDAEQIQQVIADNLDAHPVTC